MTPETIQEHLLRQPFQPFRVFLSDGSAYDVRHPEMALVTRREVIIALPKLSIDFPDIRLLRSAACYPDRADQRPRKATAKNTALIKTMSNFVICINNESNPASLILAAR